MYLVSPCSASSPTVSPSVPERNSSPSASQKDGGAHGKLAPLGSSMTASRPSAVIVTPVCASRITNVGIPCTLYFLESAAFFSRSSYGSESHGCSAKYDLNP